MKVVGIDPGLERTGFAIIEEMPRGGRRLLDCGVIKTPSHFAFPLRLHMIAEDLASVLRREHPTVAGVEELFFSKNVKTAMKVSQARGVIMEVLTEHGIPIMEFNPGTIKQSVTGDARADKLHIRKMIHYELGIRLKSDDALDAIACALCLMSSYRNAILKC